MSTVYMKTSSSNKIGQYLFVSQKVNITLGGGYVLPEIFLLEEER